MTQAPFCDAQHPTEPGLMCGLYAGHHGPHIANMPDNVNDWLEWTEDEPEPPPLGVHVTDSMALSDRLR